MADFDDAQTRFAVIRHITHIWCGARMEPDNSVDEIDRKFVMGHITSDTVTPPPPTSQDWPYFGKYVRLGRGATQRRGMNRGNWYT